MGCADGQILSLGQTVLIEIYVRLGFNICVVNTKFGWELEEISMYCYYAYGHS
jgi:hypothetical protein